jgi:hypothetical protein
VQQGSEVVLDLSLDAAVAGGKADAEKGKSRGDLIVVKEALIGLIDTAAQVT